MAVQVLDKKKRPLMPCSEKRARKLLERGRAVVVRMHPFTIRLKDRVDGQLQPVVRGDPGNQTTRAAGVREQEGVVGRCAAHPVLPEGRVAAGVSGTTDVQTSTAAVQSAPAPDRALTRQEDCNPTERRVLPVTETGAGAPAVS